VATCGPSYPRRYYSSAIHILVNVGIEGFKRKYSHRKGINRNKPPKLATEKGQLKDEFLG
jgi:hypothetical protein